MQLLLNYIYELFICRNGYPQDESDRLCSQYIFQPSEKYVPLMPLNMNM